MPKKVKDFLEKLAELNGINVEDMFRQEIIAILKNFREGGFFEKWTENALKTAEQIQKLAIEQFDC